MITDLAARLRSLRDRQTWTVAEMAERTGIPKKTLDKYMLRNNAILPGHDALMALSKGLGVSLDWLVFGSEFVSESAKLIASKAATQQSLAHFSTILSELQSNGIVPPDEELLAGMKPDEWATDLGWRVGESAMKMASSGITLEELLRWESRYSDRAVELLHERVDRFRKTSETQS